MNPLVTELISPTSDWLDAPLKERCFYHLRTGSRCTYNKTIYTSFCRTHRYLETNPLSIEFNCQKDILFADERKEQQKIVEEKNEKIKNLRLAQVEKMRLARVAKLEKKKAARKGERMRMFALAKLTAAEKVVAPETKKSPRMVITDSDDSESDNSEKKFDTVPTVHSVPTVPTVPTVESKPDDCAMINAKLLAELEKFIQQQKEFMTKNIC